MYSVFITLYNRLRKDVEQDTLSQASMLLATMPKTLVFTAISDSEFSDLLKENLKVLDPSHSHMSHEAHKYESCANSQVVFAGFSTHFFELFYT